MVIGLDGTPYSFLDKEMESGALPNLARLKRRGGFRQMETDIPPVSSVAWASFMTGRNPGEHGIFGFTDRKPGSYELYFPNYRHLAAETVWNRLSDDGARCCVLNVPSTYPASPLNGVLVSGFVAPNLEKAVYPAEAYSYLSGAGYRIDVDASRARESLDMLLEDLHATLDRRREAIFHFRRQEPWDFFMFVLTGTDRLHHFMWKRYAEEDPVYAREFMRYYSRVDELVGEFTEELSDDTALFMLSDHGFCSIHKEIYLNNLLRDRGLLSFRMEEPEMISDLEPGGTRVYCLDPGRIYLNLEGREPGGIVARDEYSSALEEIESLLLAAEDPDDGGAIIRRVVRREECYSGPYLDRAPDLLAIPHDGYDLKGSVTRQDWTGTSHLEGMHTVEDAFVYIQDEWVSEAPGHIRDLASLLLTARES